MAFLANGIDLLCDVLAPKKSSVKNGAVDNSGLKGAFGIGYALFAFMWLAVWHKGSSKHFSAILTGGAYMQCVGFAMLTLKVRATKSVAGISSKSLEMYFIFFCTRLLSTTLKNGYIPVDKSGQIMYQLFDIASLVFVGHLIFSIHKTYRYSYQEEKDTFPILPMVLPALVCACFIHADINRNLFFDIAWTFSMNLETFTMVPQLYMMVKMGGKVDAPTAHFVLCSAASRVLCFVFWWWGHVELQVPGEYNWAGKQIIGSYILQLLLVADFIAMYVKAKLAGVELVLPSREEEL